MGEPFAIRHTDPDGNFTYVERFRGLITPETVLADCAAHGGKCNQIKMPADRTDESDPLGETRR